jgi:glycosyltransferase involved in cell wall biosynthesis
MTAVAGPIRVLELRSVRGTGGGPEKTILSGAAKTDTRRFAITVCYIRDARDPVFSLDTHASQLPVDYVEIRERHSFDPSVWTPLRQLIRERGIQIVHAHDYKTNLLARLVSLVEPIVPLSTVHGWTGHSRCERLLYYPLDKRVLSWFPKLIAVSDEIRHELLRYGARSDRTVTVLNGIDHGAFGRDRTRRPVIRRSLGFTDADLVIGGVGRLEPQKRFDLLIDVFAGLRSGRPHLKMVIVGDGTLRHALQAQIARLDLGASCRLLGHRTDVADIHHALDLFVQSSDYEGTPNAVLEAMALETPIVATDAGGTAQLVRHGIDGLLAEPANVTALTSAIETALMQTEMAAKRAQSARRRVENELSFEARMRAVERVYEELVQARWGAAASAAAPA